MGRLIIGLLGHIDTGNLQRVESHVYKTNALSVNFHQKLGFEIVQENEKGFAFSIALEKLLDHPVVRRFGNAAR